MLLDRNGIGNDSFCKLLLRGDALTDGSAAGRTLTNVNGVTFAAPSKTGLPSGSAFGKAANFASVSSQAITYAATSDLCAMGKTFTLEFWGWFTAGSLYFLYDSAGSLSNNGLVIVKEASGKLSFGPDSTNYNQIQGVSTALADANFHHVQIDGDGTTFRSYIDGAPDASGTGWSITAATGTGTIGARLGGGSGYMNGQLLNFAISPGIRRRPRGFTPPNRYY